MNPTRTNSDTATDRFAHAMRREIYEQPQAIAKTVDRHLQNDILFPGALQSIESALRRFKKATQKAGILAEARKHEHYEKPSVRRKKKSAAARKRRVEAKKHRAGVKRLRRGEPTLD